MDTEKMLDADQVKENLGVSKATAYKIIRQLNSELKESGCRVVQGRVNKRFFEQTYFALPVEPKGDEGNECQ